MKHTHFSLGTAFLCVTCNCVGSNSRACACCGDSTGLLNLACVLDRRQDEPTIADRRFLAECRIAADNSAASPRV